MSNSSYTAKLKMMLETLQNWNISSKKCSYYTVYIWRVESLHSERQTFFSGMLHCDQSKKAWTATYSKLPAIIINLNGFLSHEAVFCASVFSNIVQGNPSMPISLGMDNYIFEGRWGWALFLCKNLHISISDCQDFFGLFQNISFQWFTFFGNYPTPPFPQKCKGPSLRLLLWFYTMSDQKQYTISIPGTTILISVSL